MLQPGQQVERLQTVDAQRLEKIVVGRKLSRGTLKCAAAKMQDFVQRLIGGLS